MIFNKATFLSVVTLLLICTFTVQDRLLKKVKKEIEKTYSIKVFDMQPVLIDTEVLNVLSKKIKPNTLFKIIKDNLLIGYAFVDKAPSKTDQFDYLILLDKDLIIAKAKVLVYREDYGGEIGSKRWLKQFIGKKPTDNLKYERDIIAISGATISAHSMTRAIHAFLKNIEILHQKNIL